MYPLAFSRFPGTLAFVESARLHLLSVRFCFFSPLDLTSHRSPRVPAAKCGPTYASLPASVAINMPRKDRAFLCKCSSCILVYPAGKSWTSKLEFYTHQRPSNGTYPAIRAIPDVTSTTARLANDVHNPLAQTTLTLEDVDRSLFVTTVLDHSADNGGGDIHYPALPSSISGTVLAEAVSQIHSSASSRDKREKNVATARALSKLERLRSRLQDLEPLLVSPTPTELSQLEEEICKISNLYRQITRSTPSIEDAKTQMSFLLQNAQARVMELRNLCPREPSTNPLPVDSSTLTKIRMR